MCRKKPCASESVQTDGGIPPDAFPFPLQRKSAVIQNDRPSAIMPALNGSADSAGLEHKRKSERKNSYESKSGNTGKSFLSQIIAEPKPARGGHHAGDGGLQYGGYLLHRPDQRPVQDCRHLPVLPHVLHPLRAGNPARQRRLYRHLPGSREKGNGDRETLFLLLLLCGPCPGHGVSVVGQSPPPPICGLLGADADTMADAVRYLRVIALGAPLSCSTMCSPM